MDLKSYKDIYVFAEQRRGTIQSVAYELLGKARELADGAHQKVYAILLGHKITDQANLLIQYGADGVIVVDSEHLENYLTEQYAQALSQIIDAKHPETVLFGATTIGRDLAPRLSVRLHTGLTADCTGLAIGEDGNLQMTRPAFGGNLMATILCTDNRPQMSTVRPGVMRRLKKDPNRKGEIENFQVKFDRSRFKVSLVREEFEQKKKKDITEASILVSGGRGVGSKEGFAKLEALANVINGQVSSSRSMVDAGIMDHDVQVGQTGKTVRPDVYFALGISGAIQHLAGMEESDYIIAVNRDKEAPIFNVADLGIVGDLHKIVPLLTEKLEKLRKESQVK